MSQGNINNYRTFTRHLWNFPIWQDCKRDKCRCKNASMCSLVATLWSAGTLHCYTTLKMMDFCSHMNKVIGQRLISLRITRYRLPLCLLILIKLEDRRVFCKVYQNCPKFVAMGLWKQLKRVVGLLIELSLNYFKGGMMLACCSTWMNVRKEKTNEIMAK